MKIAGMHFRWLAVCATLFALICCESVVAAQTVVKGPEGSWQGTLNAGAVKLRLVLTITQSSSGEYKGLLDSLDQGSTIPADKVTLSGDKLHAEFPLVHGVYEGVINKESTEISGTWTQGSPLPLAFKRAEPSAAPSPASQDQPKPAANAEKPFTAPVSVTIPITPTAFQADGKSHVAYELHVTNYSGDPATLVAVDVLRESGPRESGSSESGARLLRVEGTELVASVRLLGNNQAVGLEKLNVGPGGTAIIYMWLDFEGPAKVPAAVEHVITLKAGKNKDEMTVKCARVAVAKDIAVIGPPLHGDQWVAANGPSNTSGHRRTILPINGRAAIAQRFAIDWIRLNSDGRTFSGDEKDNKNYRAYGSDALAVADGTVTEVKDGIPENVPGINSRAVPITLETVGGNHVILDLGHGRFAFYAHLQPGSLKVKLGDHVKRGQVLGLVGNSGNSTEPHLHFHIGDSNSPLGAEGLPYALEWFETKAKPDAPAVKHTLEIPLENEVVTFAK